MSIMIAYISIVAQVLHSKRTVCFPITFDDFVEKPVVGSGDHGLPLFKGVPGSRPSLLSISRNTFLEKPFDHSRPILPSPLVGHSVSRPHWSVYWQMVERNTNPNFIIVGASAPTVIKLAFVSRRPPISRRKASFTSASGLPGSRRPLT